MMKIHASLPRHHYQQNEREKRKKERGREGKANMKKEETNKKQPRTQYKKKEILKTTWIDTNTMLIWETPTRCNRHGGGGIYKSCPNTMSHRKRRKLEEPQKLYLMTSTMS